MIQSQKMTKREKSDKVRFMPKLNVLGYKEKGAKNVWNSYVNSFYSMRFRPSTQSAPNIQISTRGININYNLGKGFDVLYV